MHFATTPKRGLESSTEGFRGVPCSGADVNRLQCRQIVLVSCSSSSVPCSNSLFHRILQPVVALRGLGRRVGVSRNRDVLPKSKGIYCTAPPAVSRPAYTILVRSVNRNLRSISLIKPKASHIPDPKPHQPSRLAQKRRPALKKVLPRTLPPRINTEHCTKPSPKQRSQRYNICTLLPSLNRHPRNPSHPSHPNFPPSKAPDSTDSVPRIETEISSGHFNFDVPASRYLVPQVDLEEVIRSKTTRAHNLIREMESIQLAQALGFRSNSGPFWGSQAVGSRDPYQRFSGGPPPELTPRPKGPFFSTPRSHLNDSFNIFSMEDLEDRPALAAPLSRLPEFVTATAPGLIKRPSTYSLKEAPIFPTINDVIFEFETKVNTPVREPKSFIESVEEPVNEQEELVSAAGVEYGLDCEDANALKDQDEYAEDNEDLTSGDEAFTDGSGPSSPSTSVSSTDDNDIDEQLLDNHKQEYIPQSEFNIQPMPAKDIVEHATIQLPLAADTKTERTISAPLRPIPYRSTSSRVSTIPKRAAKKNNGWKRVPKKNRLSSGSKRKFLSRSFW